MYVIYVGTIECMFYAKKSKKRQRKNNTKKKKNNQRENEKAKMKHQR